MMFEAPFKKSLPNVIKEFQQTLIDNNINTILREELSGDIEACGQLRSQEIKGETN